MKVRNTKITILKGNIAQLQCDAVVVEQETKDLTARHVIQVATTDKNGVTDEHSIREAYADALKRAEELKVSSVAIPALGCGVEGFSSIASAKIAAQEILKYLRGRDAKFCVSTEREIILCLSDDETFNTFNMTVTGYINHIQDTLSQGPYVTADIIIELDEGIILIERSNPPFGWALPGGFVDCGESLEQAAAREAKEETNMDLVDLRQFHTYSTPNRDPRFHTVSTVFIASGKGTPQFGDDAKGLKVVKYEDLPKLECAFDHKVIIKDYLEKKED